jgi:hypothetical protein
MFKEKLLETSNRLKVVTSIFPDKSLDEDKTGKKSSRGQRSAMAKAM